MKFLNLIFKGEFMNHKYNVQNQSFNSGNQALFQNLKGISRGWSVNKSKPPQSYLYKYQIGNDIINNLPANLLANISSFAELVYLKNNESLYQPDDSIHFLYFPETAVISEFQILEDGRTIEVAMIGREGVIGINSIFNSHSSQNWSQVSVAGKALRVDANIFRQEFSHCEPLQELFFEFVNKYISQISQKVICTSHHSVEERLCCWLLMIQDRCCKDTLLLTQEQIARLLGVHRPSVTLITQLLRQNGIIDYVRGKIFILDRQKLEFSSCSCYLTSKLNG